jgi:hypothetical protein
MKVTVYSIKGSAGKTPISTNIALDLGYCVGTNESINVYGDMFSEDQVLRVGQNEEFPQLTKDTDIVFDLSGSISDKSLSITSAIKQSDIVIVPIYNHLRSLQGGIQTILEVEQFTKNIVVVATKITKTKYKGKKKEGDLGLGAYDWKTSADFINIANQVKNNIDFDIPVLPLKFSNGFDLVDDEEKSLIELAESSKLLKYRYGIEVKQLKEIYKVIKNYE